MQIDNVVRPTATVNDTIARFPQAMAVFNRFGIDTCCGGGIAVAEAARLQNVDLALLSAALQCAAV